MWFTVIEKRQGFTKKAINRFLNKGYESKPDLDKIIIAVGNEDKGEKGIPFNWIGLKSLSKEMLSQPKKMFSPKEIKREFFKQKDIPYFLKTHGKHGTSAGENVMREWVRTDMTNDAIKIVNMNLKWIGASNITMIGNQRFDWTNSLHMKEYHEAMGFKEEVEKDSNVIVMKIKSRNPDKVFKHVPPQQEGDKYKINFYIKHPLYSEIKTAIQEHD